MSRTYQHLNAEERALIMLSRRAGASVRAIARTLQRSPSTISRELRRMSGAPMTPQRPHSIIESTLNNSVLIRRRTGFRPALRSAQQ